MNYKAPERMFSSRYALNFGKKIVKKQLLNSNFLKFGESYKTYRCILNDSTGTQVGTGNGKGVGVQSQTSALFEALEHYYSDLDKLPSDLPYIKISDLIMQDRLADERPFNLMKEFSNFKIPCRRYSAINGNLPPLFYPIFLTTPNYNKRPFGNDSFDYRKFSKYSTNTGTAIGLTRDEAILHGLLEVIERDAVSLFLIHTFIDKTPKQFKVLPYNNLPLNIQRLINELQNQCKGELVILDISTDDIPVPVYLASISVQNRVILPIGYGASLNRTYAIQRACLEALQSFHLHDDEMEEEEKYILHIYDDLPVFQACIKRDFTKIEKNNLFDVRKEDFNTDIGSIKKQIKELVFLLENKGFNGYYSDIWSENDIYCINVIVPGLEKFNIITSGNPVLPSMKYKNRD